MAVAYKAPVKDIVFGYEVIDSYNILSKISAFSDFSEDIVSQQWKNVQNLLKKF